MSVMSSIAAALNPEAAPVEVGTMTASVLPAVGDSVRVRHGSQENDQGVSGIVRMPSYDTSVKRVLIGGEHGQRVMVESGDVWDVTRASNGATIWETNYVRYQG